MDVVIDTNMSYCYNKSSNCELLIFLLILCLLTEHIIKIRGIHLCHE